MKRLGNRLKNCGMLMLPAIWTAVINVSTPPAAKTDIPFSMAIGASQVSAEKNKADWQPKNNNMYQARLFRQGDTRSAFPSTSSTASSSTGCFTRSQMMIAAIDNRLQLAIASGQSATV